MKIESTSPCLFSMAWAVGTSKTAKVAPPIESTEPYLAVPTTLNSCVGPSAAALIVSPSLYFSFFAVALSITTSFEPLAQLPAVNVSGLNCFALGSSPQPKFGAWPFPSFCPSRPISFTRSVVPLTS